MLNRFNRITGGQKSLPALLATGLICASSPAIGADNWEYTITPYFFAAAIDATVGVGDVETTVDLDSSDVLESTEAGFMAMLSARKDKWLLALDGTYFQLKDGESSSVTGPFGRVTADGTVELTNRQWVYQPMVGYRVLDDKLQMDVFGGLRYTRLRANMDIVIDTGSARFPGNQSSFKTEKDWTDVIAGVHVAFPLNEQWSLTGMTDVGSGEDSDLSYHLLGTVRWQFHKQMAASFGYRLLHQEFEEDAFNWDVTYSGVIIGVGFTPKA